MASAQLICCRQWSLDLLRLFQFISCARLKEVRIGGVQRAMLLFLLYYSLTESSSRRLQMAFIMLESFSRRRAINVITHLGRKGRIRLQLRSSRFIYGSVRTRRCDSNSVATSGCILIYPSPTPSRAVVGIQGTPVPWKVYQHPPESFFLASSIKLTQTTTFGVISSPAPGSSCVQTGGISLASGSVGTAGQMKSRYCSSA